MMELHGRCSRHKPTYQCWQDMKQRCLNPKAQQYPNYGARGITVCERWLASFDNFLTDMGEKPTGKTLERIDNDAGYSPENCRWATRAEQRVNQRTCRYLEHQGKRMTLVEWARSVGMNPATLWRRLDRGYPMELALTSRRLQIGRASPAARQQEAANANG